MYTAMSHLTPDFQRRVLREKLRSSKSSPQGDQLITDDWYTLDTGTEHTMEIESCDNQQALRWFDRGLVWVWGYNPEEAVSCFEMALQACPDFAMAHWGIAYAHGPFYNGSGAHLNRIEPSPHMTHAIEQAKSTCRLQQIPHTPVQ